MHSFKYEIAQKALLQVQEGNPFYTLRELANEYNCSPSTVSKYRDEFVEDNQIIDHHRYNGQAPTLSERDQRAIVREFKKIQC